MWDLNIKFGQIFRAVFMYDKNNTKQLKYGKNQSFKYKIDYISLVTQ